MEGTVFEVFKLGFFSAIALIALAILKKWGDQYMVEKRYLREEEGLRRKQDAERREEMWAAELQERRDAEDRRRLADERIKEIEMASKPDFHGYMLVEMDEAKKSIFQDILKGFEDYAHLKGYKISFSSDTSQPRMFAFKFTIMECGVTVSPQQVRRDIKEFISKLESGEDFAEIPQVLSLEEHEFIKTKLLSRLNFLHHSLKQEKITNHLYESFFAKIGPAAFSHPPNIFVQGSGQLQAPQYMALNSSQIAQGEGHRMTGNTSQLSVNLGHNAGERMELARLANEAYSELWSEKEHNEEAKKVIWQIQENLKKIETELKDEPDPSPSRVERYLTFVKNAAKTVSFGKDATDAIQKLLAAFSWGG